MTEFSTFLKCEYFPLCSGCESQGDISSPSIWKETKEFFQRIALDIPISLIVKDASGWRTRCKLAVRGTSLHPEIGLFKHRSHQVVSIPSCPLHHPSINAVYSEVQKAMIEGGIDPYNEEKGTGTLRYIQCTAQRKSGKVQLVLVVNQHTKDDVLERFVKQLYKSIDLHSVWINFQPEKTNRIFGETWTLCDGEPYLWEVLGDVDCAFHPACFSQANLNLFEDALRRIQEWIPPNENILELYAGIGVIGLSLARLSKKVLCVEINPYSLECFEMSRLKLPSNIQDKISMRVSSSENALPLIPGNGAIVVDPPRKGLESSVLNAICSADLGTQLIYLSCGPLSFQRDVEKLVHHGWKIKNAEAYLFFPGSNHVEILCSLKKVSG